MSALIDFVKKSRWLQIIALVAITFATYSSAMQNGMVWDDEVYITDQELTGMEGLKAIWFNVKSTDHPYYPLTHTSFWLEYQVWQYNNVGSHLVNVALQGLNAVLVFLILGLFGVPGAWLCAAVFAVHPVHVESVAWISERKNLLAGLFYFLSLLAFFRYYAPGQNYGDGRRGRRMLYALSLLCFALSLLSKTAFCMLPVTLLLLIFWKRRKLDFEDASLTIPHFVIAIVLGLMTVWLEKNHVGAQGADFDFSLIDRILIASRALWFYAGKLLLPVKLMFIYPRWEINASDPWQYLYPAGLLAICTAFWVFRRRIGLWPLVAVLFFIINLLPALGFISFYMMIFSFVADHLQYIASLGIIVLVIAPAAAWARRLDSDVRPLVAVIAVLVVGALSVRAWYQVRIYKDELTFYNNILQENPDCWMAYNNRGRLHERNGNFDLAFLDYNQAIETNPTCHSDSPNPNCMRSYNNRGIAYKAKGQLKEALADFNRAIEINPAFHKAYLNRGAVHFTRKDFDLALEDFDKALAYQPGFAKAYMNKGLAYHEMGDLDKAVEEYTRAIQINPRYDKAYVNRAGVYMLKKEYANALQDYNRAIAANPGYAMAYFNRSLIKASREEFREALMDAMRARLLGATVNEQYIQQLQSALQYRSVYGDLDPSFLNNPGGPDAGPRPE